MSPKITAHGGPTVAPKSFGALLAEARAEPVAEPVAEPQPADVAVDDGPETADAPPETAVEETTADDGADPEGTETAEAKKTAPRKTQQRRKAD